MQRLLELILIVFFIFTRIKGKHLSYFEGRRRMLHRTEITLYPRPLGSKVDEIYYGPQKPKSSNYQLIINEDQMCSKHEKIFLFVAVRTIYNHDIRRRIFREVVSHYQKRESALLVRHAFLFGQSNDKSENKQIKEESLMFRDIVQADFLESYGNLTRKTLLAWNWSVESCPNAEYVMVVNDELFIDMDKLVSFLYKDFLVGHHDDRLALCNPIDEGTAVNHTHKPFTMLPADDLYKGAYYPTYCHGHGYVAHIKTINKLLKASVSNPYFMPDDVWIGVLSERLRLRLPNHQSLYVDSNLEGFFTSETYHSSTAFIAVTGEGINKGYEHLVMLNIISSMREHWQHMKRSDEFGSNKQIPYLSEDGSNLKLYLILLFFFVCALKYRPVVKKLFSRSRTRVQVQ